MSNGWVSGLRSGAIAPFSLTIGNWELRRWVCVVCRFCRFQILLFGQVLGVSMGVVRTSSCEGTGLHTRFTSLSFL